MENRRESKLLSDGRELFKKNSLKKAFILFDEIVNINPENAEAYFYLGNIFHIQGQLGKAVKAFNKVLALDSNHTDAAISLSVILNDIGRYEDAKVIFEKANEKIKNEKVGFQSSGINQKFSAKHFEIAEMYFTYNRYEEALSEYNKACGLDPENLEIRVKIAKAYSKKGYVSKAFEVLRSLKSEHPAFLPARVALGLLHYGKGNTIEAQTEWQNALLKDPTNEEIQMYLSLSKNATETNLNA
ncbi:MAG: tetratricopeptide repeat protein [Halobacteriovoraceae bacterium]|mgnify:CR=1 FL=1|nr:tetratricopeptide repeat protein [Halobacteriovoraceae bacterium]